MINFPNQTELNELKNFKEPYSLSIYAPYIDSNAATNPNRIEVKNLLHEAETALLAAGVSAHDTKRTLKPARLKLEGQDFWPVHRGSIALFMHTKIFRYYQIPDPYMPYLLTVEKGFNLEPLLEAMKTNKQYLVLALGHKNVHLYEGDQYQLKPVQLKNFPTNMKEALNIDEYPNWRETHDIAPAYMGKGSQASHGQYNVKQTDKDMLLAFFRRIDKRLHTFLLKKHDPLILAGVDYLMPIYRKANSYQYLRPDYIKGNIEHTDLSTIRQRAWELLDTEKQP